MNRPRIDIEAVYAARLKAMTVKEIAAMFGASERAVRWAIQRKRDQIRSEVQK